MSDYITKADLEQFRKEIIAELTKREIKAKKGGNGKLLIPVYRKWIHNKGEERKPLQQLFRINAIQSRKIWDAIRALTCAVCDANRVEDIKDTDMALDFCEKLCEFIDSYMLERTKGG